MEIMAQPVAPQPYVTPCNCTGTSLKFAGSSTPSAVEGVVRRKQPGKSPINTRLKRVVLQCSLLKQIESKVVERSCYMSRKYKI